MFLCNFLRMFLRKLFNQSILIAQTSLLLESRVWVTSEALHVRLLVANCADERGQTDRQKDIQTDRQTDRQRDIQTDRQTD